MSDDLHHIYRISRLRWMYDNGIRTKMKGEPIDFDVLRERPVLSPVYVPAANGDNAECY